MSNSTNQYICIHGHFYQPPRENPWLNKVELQESAYPYHDWNERITAECYDPNAFSRVLNESHQVIQIYNNYSNMSFDVGPTLLEWLHHEAPRTYQAILDADKHGVERFNGHGPAMAQSYNHLIMPLANDRDKETQVIWGIEDFEHRFGRKPEGMWLSETAVDIATLETLASHDIVFTVLSPYQANATRKRDEEEWQDVSGGKINPNRPYRCLLPSGRHIDIFFYQANASQAVAFDGWLKDGQIFAEQLMQQFNTGEEQTQIVHIATDGETYGHHHKHGDMALSSCLYEIDQKPVCLTVYGEYLEKFPPKYEVQIVENSSWSCSHGVERWKSDCGCNTGNRPEWNQAWRRPLRDTFDWVRDQVVPLYEKEMVYYTDDPWKIRNKYIQIILDRSPSNISAFLEENFGNGLAEHDEVKLLKLLEMQYHAMLMYTSCGWFFDEVTGIESMQDILYATRVIQLADEISGENLEEGFLNHLESIPSNLDKYENVKEAFEEIVVPMRVDILRVGVHYAVSSLFRNFPGQISIYNFDVKSHMHEVEENGKQKLAVGRALLQSRITREKIEFSYAVLHMGENNLFSGVKRYENHMTISRLHKEMSKVFNEGRIYEVLHLMDTHFGDHRYSFWHLFRDDQREIMEIVMHRHMAGAKNVLQEMYEKHYPVLRVYQQLSLPLPKSLEIPVKLALNNRLAELIENEHINLRELRQVFKTMQRINAKPDLVTLHFLADHKVAALMSELKDDPEDLSAIHHIRDLVHIIRSGGLEPEYRFAQNIAFRIRQDVYESKCGAETKDDTWCSLFDELYISLNLVP